MIDRLRPISTATCACKICGSAAPLFGVVDFHKNCEEARGVQLPLSGNPVYYRRCTNCKFLFTDSFDDWTTEQFKAHIYNDDYRLFDPDYADSRPLANAGAIVRLWGAIRQETRVLDYGGGNDRLCAALRQAGFQAAVTYDPMVPEHAIRPAGKFDLVTSFETLEHVPDPLAAIRSMVEFAGDPGLIFFRTLLQPADFDQQRLNWWYVAPRNGHVSLFSRDALALAWERHGYRFVSASDDVHFAFRTLPKYVSIPLPPQQKPTGSGLAA